jgi:hypothetical protein
LISIVTRYKVGPSQEGKVAMTNRVESQKRQDTRRAVPGGDQHGRSTPTGERESVLGPSRWVLAGFIATYLALCCALLIWVALQP